MKSLLEQSKTGKDDVADFIHYPTYPKTLELLRDRAANDPDEQLREWAEGQLRQFNHHNQEDSQQKALSKIKRLS